MDIGRLAPVKPAAIRLSGLYRPENGGAAHAPGIERQKSRDEDFRICRLLRVSASGRTWHDDWVAQADPKLTFVPPRLDACHDDRHA